MPGIMIERPKMTRTMYQALKRHIMKERERKKQEQAQDEELEKQRKEQELRRKKEVQDSLTLEQTKEQLGQAENKLGIVRQEKHELFSQLKKVLHQEDETRKRAQEKEHNEMVASMQQQQQQFQGIAPSGQHMYPLPTQISKYMNVSSIQQHRALLNQVKRPRSPSPPPPTSVYTNYPPNKYQANAYSARVKEEYNIAKSAANYQPPSSHGNYTSQSAPSFAQANPNLYPGSSSKYSSNQSAFSSYPTHYAHQQQLKEHGYPPPPKEHAYPGNKEHVFPPQKEHGYPAQKEQHGYPAPKEHGYPGQYPVSRLTQQQTRAQPSGRTAYMSAGGHSSSNLPLQQQLEHASKQSGFAEDNYKIQQMRGLAHHPASAPNGSISSGFPIRTQASSSSAYQPQTSQSVVSSSQQHAYAQHRFY